MRNRIGLAAVTTVLLLCSILGCNNSSRGKSFNKNPDTTVGHLRVFYAQSLTTTERQALTLVVGQHINAFNQRIVPTIQFAFPNLPHPTTQRDLYIYDVPYINAPWALSQLGWTDMDENNRINVVAGHCNLLPDLTHQLTHSYYFPYDIHHQTAVVGNTLVWTTVAQVESDLLTQLKIQYFCPH